MGAYVHGLYEVKRRPYSHRCALFVVVSRAVSSCRLLKAGDELDIC